MDASELLVQFITVFLGAFLAFWLEDVRAGRQLRHQLRTYVRQFAASLQEDAASRDASAATIRQIIGVYERLTQPDDVPTEEDWQMLSVSFTASFPDRSFLFSGESLSVLPTDIVAAFREFEEHVTVMQSRLDDYRTLQLEYVVPLVIRQPQRLEDADKRALGLVKAQLEQFQRAFTAMIERAPSMLERFEQHGY